jgi:hypothetical protein
VGEPSPEALPTWTGGCEQVKAELLARLPSAAPPRPAPAPRVWPEWMSLAQLAEYSGLSRTTLIEYINADPAIALPCYRPRDPRSGKLGKILVRRDEFDAWMKAWRTVGRPELLRNLAELGLEDLV